MPFVDVTGTDRASSAKIYYREYGDGPPLIFLHGGWGYEIYPFGKQMELLAGMFRVLIPDRSGYGRSTKVDHLPVDFHRGAASETVDFMDALGVERAFLWGHSDGAVIAALVGLTRSQRCRGLILEAFHYFRAKPSSREFFRTAVTQPEKLGPDVCRILALEHGEPYWRQLIGYHGRAWLDLATEGDRRGADFYGGRLSRLAVPLLFIHGSHDPRTERTELGAVREQLPRAPLYVIKGGGHSPHSGAKTADECNRLAHGFLEGLT